MAGLLLHAPTGEVALTASTAKTVGTIITAANDRVRLKALEVFFKGTSATDTPVKIELLRGSGADGTGTTITIAPNDENAGETIQTVCKSNYSAEPGAYGALVKMWEVHPQTGVIVFLPLGDELIIKGGNRIGIRMTSSQSETVSLDMYFDE